MAVWSTTHINNEGHNQESNDGDDLNTCEDELCLSIDLDGEDVQADNKNDDQRDPGCDIDVISPGPVLDDDGCGTDFGTESYGRVVPILRNASQLLLLSASEALWSWLLISSQTNTGKTYVPSYSESKSIIAVAGTELRNRTGKRQPSGHLTQALHHGEDRDTSEGVAKQDRERTSLSESTSDT